jgi:hypothetical protein
MKKLLLTLLFAAGLAGGAVASGKDKEARQNQKAVKEKQVQAYVEAALAAAYGEPSEGQWRVRAITREFQQAAFIQRSIRKSLFFSPDNARMLASIELVEPAELSAKLTRKLARKYKGYHVAQVIKYFDGETLYFVSLKNDQEEILVSYARQNF